MIWEPHAKSQNSKLMRQNEYVNVFKMASCVPNSEASHVMSGLEKICSTTYCKIHFQLLSVLRKYVPL